MIQDNGVVVWAAQHEAFGKAEVTVSTVENPLRFPGQYFDGETGLHYNYMRDYDPGIGRYTRSDPIGLKGGLNTYIYVGGNPISWYDITGTESECKFTPWSFKLSPSGQFRTIITRQWDRTICLPLFQVGPVPTPPSKGKASPWDWVLPPLIWKCQTIYYSAGHKEELYTAMAWGILRCYNDCGELTDETVGYKRWKPADQWQKVEDSDFVRKRLGPIYP